MNLPRPADRAVLSVEGLRVSFQTEGGVVRAVEDVSLRVGRGEIVGIVGESGSGKSVTVLTLMGLTRSPNASILGRATLDGIDLISASEADLEKVRGSRLAIIFQDPMSALNPVMRVGAQVIEQMRAHQRISKRAASERTVALLDRVGIPHAAERLRAYPHEFSGGMRQRVMIAMALSCSPDILIADEATTALDVTIQAQILEEFARLRAELGIGVLLITHDLGIVADIADRIVVMYAGQVVEQGSVEEVFYDPLHPYTWGLLGSVPRVDKDPPHRLPAISGSPPSLLYPQAGCHFAPRCPWRFERCTEPPPLAERAQDAPDHLDRCWMALAEKRERRVVGEGIGLPALVSDASAKNRGTGSVASTSKGRME